MVASALRVVLTATSACVRSGSRELSVKRVSQQCFWVPMHYECFLAVGRCKKSPFFSSLLWTICLPCLVSICPGFLLSSPLFNETVYSYAVVPWPQSSQNYLSFMEFEVTFRPSVPDGTLLYSEDSGSGDFLAINLVDRYVEFRFDCGSGGATIRLSKFILFSVSFTKRIF